MINIFFEELENERMNEYKLGYEMGKYKSMNEIVINIYKNTFGSISCEERKRINWLSNIELEILFDKLIECLKDKENLSSTKETEKEILKLLR